jgi:hypothetical protein
MATVTHKYVGKPESESEQAGRAAKREREAELAVERTAAVRANRMRSEMLLAKARGELILRDLVERQASYLLVCHRQQLLAVPQRYAARLLNIGDAHEMAMKLREMVLGLLEELQDLPARVTDEHWLEHIADDNGAPKEKGGRDIARGEIATPAKARTPRRRRRKG